MSEKFIVAPIKAIIVAKSGPQGPPGPAGSGGSGVATALALAHDGGYWRPTIAGTTPSGGPIIEWEYSATLPSGAATGLQLTHSGTTWAMQITGLTPGGGPIIEWVPQ